MDDLLMCTLPYHSTPQFVRLVHLIEPKGRWLFLNGVKKTGAPLSRTVLAACCAADRAVLTFICDLAKEPGAPRVSLGLFVGTCVELLTTARKVPEDMTLAIFPVLLEGLRSSTSADLQASAYMVLSSLVKRVTLGAEVLKTVLEIIPKYANREAPLPSLLVLVAVCHYQRPKVLPEKSLPWILRMQSLASLLAQVAKEVDASHVTSLLLPVLVRSAPTDKQCLDDLKSLVAQVPLDARLVALLARELTLMCRKLHNVKEKGISLPREHPGVQHLGQVLCELGNRYPEHMDAFISTQLKGGAGSKEDGDDDDSEEEESSDDEDDATAKFKGAQRDWLVQFLSKTFHGTRHCPVEEGGTTLLLALEHPAPAVRLAAVSRLSKTVSGDAPPDFLAEALLRRIDDDDAGVALAALSWDKLVNIVAPDLLVRALSAAADGKGGKRQWANPAEGAALQEQALRVLATSLLEHHPHLAVHVAKVLLRHMMVYPKSRRRNALALKLAAAVSHPLFAGLTEIWQQWKDSRSEAADSGAKGSKDKDTKKSKTSVKTPAKKPEGEASAWDLNMRVVGALSNNMARAKSQERVALLALLADSGARLLQALVLSTAMAKLKGPDALHAAECLSVVLEVGAAETAAARGAEDMAVDDEEVEAELTAQVLERLFPSEVVSNSGSWRTLHLKLWKVVLGILTANKVALDFAGQPAENMASEGLREVALMRRLFIAFTALSSVSDYSAHIKQLLVVLGSKAALPFLSWFVRDTQRANEHTRAHALYIGASILQGQTSSTSTRTEALGRVAQVLPSVLAALHDEEPLVRHAAVTWLRAAAGLGKEDGSGKVKWPKDRLLGLVPAGDLLQFLGALVSCSDELLSDAAHLPTFFERALMLERMETDEEEEEDNGISKALSLSSKESMQEMLIRQTVMLRTEDLMAQVMLRHKNSISFNISFSMQQVSCGIR